MQIMALIVCVVFFFFFAKIFFAIFLGIARLFFALIQFWLVGLLVVFIFCIPALFNEKGGTTRESSEAVRSASSAVTQSSDQKVWVALMVVALVMLVAWFFIHRASKKNDKSAGMPPPHKKISMKKLFSAAHPAAQLTSPGSLTARSLAAVTPKGPTKKDPKGLVISEIDQEFFRTFRRRNPWVSVDVPAKFSEQYLVQCQWLEARTKKVPGLADHVAILRDVSAGWVWEGRP